MRRKKAKCLRTVRTKKYETSYSTHVCPQRIFVGFCKISRQTGQKNFLSMSWEFGKTLALAILSIVSQEQKPVICLAWSQISQKLTSPRFRVLDWVFESSGFSYKFSKMADATLSVHETKFIVNGVEQDFRSDGRSCQDYRYFEVETGIVSNTSGSARLRLVSTINIFFSPTLSEIFRTNTLTFERLLRSVQNRYPYWSQSWDRRTSSGQTKPRTCWIFCWLVSWTMQCSIAAPKSGELTIILSVLVNSGGYKPRLFEAR